MRALVTGCAGFIGSHLTEALLRRGDAVVGIDCFNDNYGRPEKLRNLREFMDREGFQFVPVDLARGDLDELTADREVVFHLAAEPGIRTSWGARYRHYVENNIMATQQLLDAVRGRPEVRFVHASSSSVYGHATVRPTPEETPASPFSPYGQTKLGAEHLCSLYRANYGVDAVSLRYFTVFGPRQRPDMAFHAFCRSALDREPVAIFGDGHQTRDFTYVDDVVAATVAAGEADLGDERTLNVGGGAPASVSDVLALLGELVGAPLERRHLDFERGDVRDTAADTARARALLGFSPRTSLREGLAAQLDWLSASVSRQADLSR